MSIFGELFYPDALLKKQLAKNGTLDIFIEHFEVD